jgi:hypothetical protein
MAAKLAHTIDLSKQLTSTTAEDGCLLLSIEGGLVFSINGSGLRIWELLEQHRSGATVDEVVDHLELYYADCAPARDRLVRDTQLLLAHLSERGLVRVEGSGPSTARFCVREDVFRTDAATVVVEKSVQEYDESTRYLPHDPPETHLWRSFSDTFKGFCALLIYDVILRLWGFGRICKTVERCRVTRKRRVNSVRVRQVCAAVDRARLWYPKSVLCLQHSAVIAWLLRKQGADARMKIAGRQMPFYAHAWVEVGSTVVNDEQSVRERYHAFRRCLNRS